MTHSEYVNRRRTSSSVSFHLPFHPSTDTMDNARRCRDDVSTAGESCMLIFTLSDYLPRISREFHCSISYFPSPSIVCRTEFCADTMYRRRTNRPLIFREFQRSILRRDDVSTAGELPKSEQRVSLTFRVDLATDWPNQRRILLQHDGSTPGEPLHNRGTFPSLFSYFFHSFLVSVQLPHD